MSHTTDAAVRPGRGAAPGPAAGGLAGAQRGINGLVSGSCFALGAVGLTLVYGTLRLVNFAHGDLLTFGAYIAFLANVTWGVPLVAATVFAIVVTAALGVLTERTMWRPMRARGAGVLQLMLMTLGLAFVIRYGIQLIWGTQPRRLDVDVTSSIGFLGLRIGRTELIVVLVGVATLLAVGLMLRLTSLGRQMRALSDDFSLAEVAGVDTDRVVIATWIFAAGLAGLAGVLYTSAIGTMTPNLGFFLLLSLFAAVILGGIGNAYGALAGGLLLGLAQEWSTLVIDARWKVAVGFAILILVLIVRPQGLFGRKERTL
jgi:neutral amino acid transport system permease protein